MNRIYALSDDEFKDLVNSSYSYLQCILKVGYSKNGRYAYDLVRKRCEELNISTDHFTKNRHNKYTKRELSEILVENSDYSNLTFLKERLINDGLLDYRCSICGNIGVWNDQPLSLQLDHINGDHHDNRIDNLRLLCPNCHAQTETFSTKRMNVKNDKI